MDENARAWQKQADRGSHTTGQNPAVPRGANAGFTRRIIGFGTEPAYIHGVSVCRMFNHATSGQRPPKRPSTDNDPLFRFYRWLANLRVLEIAEIKSVPYIPVSHPFVERLIGTIRREYLARMFVWNALDLARKLGDFKIYYNDSRCH